MRSCVGALIVLVALATSARAEKPACLHRQEYVRYCAACHGEQADGKGPAAAALTPPPPALTSLKKKFGDPLSTNLVVFLDGRTMPRAHGTSGMPVWGRELRDQTGSEDAATGLLWQILLYLQCIQTD